jgi:hypothetical protein
MIVIDLDTMRIDVGEAGAYLWRVKIRHWQPMTSGMDLGGQSVWRSRPIAVRIALDFRSRPADVEEY